MKPDVQGPAAALFRSGAIAALGALALFPALARAADADGAALFRQRCQSCHVGPAGTPSPLAPDLNSVVGRKAAASAFNYSPALKASGLTWTKANLDQFLAAPTRKVPGTRMVIAVGDKAQRAALIAYLEKKR